MDEAEVVDALSWRYSNQAALAIKVKGRTRRKVLTDDEKLLLRRLEEISVTKGGLLYPPHFEKEDILTLKRWNRSGFVYFGAVSPHSHMFSLPDTHWCRLSALAKMEAYRARSEEADRKWTDKRWLTVAETQK